MRPLPQDAAGAQQRYRFRDGSEFAVVCRDAAELALVGLAGSAGAASAEERLLRDAGGETPREAVYRNSRLRATVGLGAEGRGAQVEPAVPLRALECEQRR